MKLRQIGGHTFFEINESAFDLLENQCGGQDLRDRSEEKPGVTDHRRTGDDVRHAYGSDGLSAVVVQACEISRRVARAAIGGGLPA